MRQGPAHPIHGSQPAVAAAGHSHHYRKPRGPSGGPGWYPPGGNRRLCLRVWRGGQGEALRSGKYEGKWRNFSNFLKE